MPSLSSLFQRSGNKTTHPNGAGTGAPHQTKAFCLILGFGGKKGHFQSGVSLPALPCRKQLEFRHQLENHLLPDTSKNQWE